jgi:hypothetical protein
MTGFRRMVITVHVISTILEDSLAMTCLLPWLFRRL